jgi:transposase
MKAYSYDLRLRVLRAADQGRSRAEIVAMFAVSLATLKRYLKRQRETGDVRTKLIPGRPAKKGAALQAGLLSQLDAYPDATLAEHCQIWETTQGMQVSSATMSRAIQRLNWTRKKKTDAAQVNRRKRSVQLGETKPRHLMQGNWSTLNRFWPQVYKPNKLSSWII